MYQLTPLSMPVHYTPNQRGSLDNMALYIYLLELAATGSSEIVRRIFEEVSFSLFNFHTFCFPVLIAFMTDVLFTESGQRSSRKMG